MGGNFGDNAAKEPGSILIEGSGVSNVRVNRGTTGTLDDAGEAPGGGSSGNSLQTEQVTHLKEFVIKEDTMAPKPEIFPGTAPSTRETPKDVKPVTHHKVNLKHPIGEAASESGPEHKRRKTDHDSALINAADSNHNIDQENGASPPVQQYVLNNENTEPEGVATPPLSQSASPSSQNPDQENGQPPSVQQLDESPWATLGAETLIILEGTLGTRWPSGEWLILLQRPDQYEDLVMSLNYFWRAFGNVPTSTSIHQDSLVPTSISIYQDSLVPTSISIPQDSLQNGSRVPVINFSVLLGSHFPEINAYVFTPMNSDSTQQFYDSDDNSDADPEVDDDVFNIFSRNRAI